MSSCELVFDRIDDDELLKLFTMFHFMAGYFDQAERPEMSLFFGELRDLVYDEALFRDLIGMRSEGAQPVHLESFSVLSSAELLALCTDLMTWAAGWGDKGPGGGSLFRRLNLGVLDELSARNGQVS